MSHHEVQRVLVRMQYDPEFAQRVVDGDPNALRGRSLSDDETRWLRSIDVRAFATDPLRRRRTLRVITEEYKVSSTLVLSQTRSLASLEKFFESPYFVTAIYAHEPIVLAFGSYVEKLLDIGVVELPQLEDVLQLERTMAACRRDRRGYPEDADLRLAPGVRVLQLEGNVFETIHTVEKFLFEMTLVPQIMLATDGPRLPELPDTDAQHPVDVLLRAQGSHVELSYLDEGTAEVLTEVVTGTPMGGEPVDALVEEGILVR